MAGAAVGALQRGLAEVAGGIVVGPETAEAPVGTMHAMVGDHPIPGRKSFAAAARISQILKEKRGSDLGVVLISGGASSLIGAPLRGMSESDFSQLFDLVLGSGLDINGMNAIRKRFSFWGAGRMALALAPAPTYCFAVSDVPGDDLPTIGSGPCVADPTRVQQVIELMQRTGIHGRVSSSLRQYLTDTARGVIPETPKATHPAFAHVTARVIANNSAALNAAAATARRSGLTATVNDQALIGDAASAGARVADALLALRERAEPGSAHCVIWGGETTVALRMPAAPGGRCQEMALAAAKRLGEAGERATGITVLAAGTDGRDGATDAAGGVVDATTWSAIASSGRDAGNLLRSHESYDALSSVNALFKPGLTGTNVMDVVIGIVKRDS